jgi:hypothetical protein
MRNWVITAVGAVLLFGCSGGAGTMNGIMSSWQGAHIDAVISQWGFPHAERQIAGRKLYYWYRNTTLTMPSTTTGTVNVIGNTAYLNTQTSGGGSSNWACTRILGVNGSNTVTSWQWEGNNCPFAEAFQYANWRNRNAATKEEREVSYVAASEIKTETLIDVTPYKARAISGITLWARPLLYEGVVEELISGSTIEIQRASKNWLFVMSNSGKQGYVLRHKVER